MAEEPQLPTRGGAPRGARQGRRRGHPRERALGRRVDRLPPRLAPRRATSSRSASRSSRCARSTRCCARAGSTRRSCATSSRRGRTSSSRTRKAVSEEASCRRVRSHGLRVTRPDNRVSILGRWRASPLVATPTWRLVGPARGRVGEACRWLVAGRSVLRSELVRASAQERPRAAAARSGLVCSIASVVPGIAFVWVGFPFVVAGAGLLRSASKGAADRGVSRPALPS